MPYEVLGAGGLTVEALRTLDRMLLDRARPRMIYNMFGEKRSLPPHGGRSIEWRRHDAIANSTTALTEGTPGASIRGTFITVTATLNQYGQYVQITDVAELQSFDDILPSYVENLGEAMGDSLDILTRDILVAGTTIQYAGIATSRGAVGSGLYLNSAEIREAVTTLKRNNARPVVDGKFVCFMHVDAWQDLMADSNLVNAMQYAGPRTGENSLWSGQVPDYLGLRFFESSNGDIRTSLGLSGANVYRAVFMGSQAYGVADYDAMPPQVYVHPPGSSGAATDPLNQVGSIGYKAAHAAAILNQAFIVVLEHVTSRSQAA